MVLFNHFVFIHFHSNVLDQYGLNELHKNKLILLFIKDAFNLSKVAIKMLTLLKDKFISNKY